MVSEIVDEAYLVDGLGLLLSLGNNLDCTQAWWSVCWTKRWVR